MKWLLDLLVALPTTLLLWALAMLLGAALGALIAYARMHRSKWMSLPATIYIEVLRGIPTLVWLFIIFFGLTQFGFRLTALVSAVLTLGLVSSAYFAEIYRSGLQAVPRSQTEATVALGLPPLISLTKVIGPQALPIILAGSGSFAIHLVKETALASLIGVVELMNVANYSVERGASGINVFFAAGLVYLVLCLPIAWGADRIGRRVNRKAEVSI